MDLIIATSGSCDAILLTTTQMIAEVTQVSHTLIMHRIGKYVASRYRLPEFRVYITDPDGIKRPKTFYYLTEEQTYTLIQHLPKSVDREEVERQFAKQFEAMQQQLDERKTWRSRYQFFREKRKDNMPPEDWNSSEGRKYSELAYRMTFGMNIKQYRKVQGHAQNEASISYMSATELRDLTHAEFQLRELLGAGLDYDTIRKLVLGTAEENIDEYIMQLHAPPVSAPVGLRGRASTLWHKFISLFRSKTAEPPDNTDAGDNAA